MSKIVQAVNSMISNSRLITDIWVNESEIFFCYNKKYTWSMYKNANSEFTLFYYPDGQTPEKLSQLDPTYFADGRIRYASYRDVDIGTREAKATYIDLYSILYEKAYGIDDVLDDIISDSEIPF